MSTEEKAEVKPVYIQYLGKAGSPRVFPTTEKRVWKTDETGLESPDVAAPLIEQGHFKEIDPPKEEPAKPTKKATKSEPTDPTSS
jgi:hypothetical protein